MCTRTVSVSISKTARHQRTTVLLALLVLAAHMPLMAQVESAAWLSAGQDLANTRSQPQESGIGPTNVGTLHTTWTFTTGGNVSATPTVSGNAVYFPDLRGNLFAVNKLDGSLLWSHKISDYSGVYGAYTRVSPAIDGTHLFIGDKLGVNPVRPGADLISIDSATGALEWITQVESHPAAIITGSPIVYDGVVYIGVSSSEEGFAEQASYACCTFRGSLVALDEATGKVLWKTYTVPDNGGKPGGYSGGSIWSPPAIDVVRKRIYVGTANNYTAPSDVDACENANPGKNCAAPDDYFDSVLSLDLKTGAIVWGTHLRPYDIWTLACNRPAAPQANCPVPSSVDSGSGSGPNLIGNMVGIGQKDGTYWALNADTGAPIWKTQVGPGGGSGGVLWGTATDGSRIYVAEANSNASLYTLEPSGETITWGAWSALDSTNGQILWQTADPTAGIQDPGAVSVANGVMYAGSNSGHMYALDALTGSILWDFNSGGSVIDGPSIVDGTVFWGSGYSDLVNDKVFAFVPSTASQSITFGVLPNQTYGKSPFALAAKASSGLPVTYSVTGPATVSGSTLTITGAGTVTVTATQAGNAAYSAATAITHSFIVYKPLIYVTANNASRDVGAPNPAFGYSLTGFVNGDTSAVLGGSVSETTAATSVSAPGTYPITFSNEALTASNYSFRYLPGTLTVVQPVVQPVGTTTTLVVNPAGSLTVGEPVMITVTVIPASGTAIPSGTITLTDTAGASATMPLGKNGTVVLSTSRVSAGTYSVYATYNGATGFAKSTSPTITENVLSVQPK